MVGFGEYEAAQGAWGQKGSVVGSLSVNGKKGTGAKQMTEKLLLLSFSFLFQMREPTVSRQSVDELGSKCSEAAECPVPHTKLFRFSLSSHHLVL